MYNENKSLFLMVKLFLQKSVIFNMITDSFLVKKWRTLERTGR